MNLVRNAHPVNDMFDHVEVELSAARFLGTFGSTAPQCLMGIRMQNQY